MLAGVAECSRLKEKPNLATALSISSEFKMHGDVIVHFVGMNASAAAIASLGDGQATAPTARLVIAEVMRSLGNKLHDELFTAKRNASGDTTADLFDGWGTIIDQEITAGTISKANGNLLQLTDAIDGVNAVDIAKEIERSCDRLGLPFYEDCASCHSKQRVNAEFTLNREPSETNIIVFDDFVTTGQTMLAMKRLFAPLRHNVVFIAAINNKA